MTRVDWVRLAEDHDIGLGRQQTQASFKLVLSIIGYQIGSSGRMRRSGIRIEPVFIHLKVICTRVASSALNSVSYSIRYGLNVR